MGTFHGGDAISPGIFHGGGDFLLPATFGIHREEAALPPEKSAIPQGGEIYPETSIMPQDGEVISPTIFNGADAIGKKDFHTSD